MIARVFAKKLQDTLGQPVIVDNKAGAAGIIGSELVAKAPPDGYTLVVGSSGTMAINPSLTPSCRTTR
jgi:tripartite-type tricarboxylate transporter receptor subunit TctC